MAAESFGQTLRRFRQRAGMTITELAEALGSGRRTITCWEQDERVPRDRARLLDLAQVLRLQQQETEHLLSVARVSGATSTPDTPPPKAVDTDSVALPPYHIAPPVADFTGRSAEIAQVITSLQMAAAGGFAALGAIQGMGGIGKTELAIVIASRLNDTFTDGRLMLNLRGTSEAPLPVNQALQQVIHAFKPDMQLPDDLEQLQRYYYSILHHKRVLILADDATSAAQVRPLIPPAGSALLLTSRMRFTLPGLVTIALTPLPDTEAVMFLRNLCATLIETEARALAQACGYLPLALRTSGSLLHNDPALGVADYLAHLRDERQRLALLRDPDDQVLDVAAALALSYAQLDADAQQVFRQLGVFVSDFGTALACTVVGATTMVDVSATLRYLLRRNLVMYDRERARWRLHDLVRDLARHQLESAGEIEILRWRYARAMAILAQELHQQYLAGGAQASAALARFDAERPHLEAAWTWGSIHSETAEGAQILFALGNLGAAFARLGASGSSA